LPVYKIGFDDKGKHVHPASHRRFDYVVDLKDPEGKVLPACRELATERADKRMKDVLEATQKKVATIRGPGPDRREFETEEDSSFLLLPRADLQARAGVTDR
jgi:hypothetical protein